MKGRCFVCDSVRVSRGTTIHGKLLCIDCWNEILDVRDRIVDVRLAIMPRRSVGFPGRDKMAEMLRERR